MADQLQLRGGTTAQTATFTGALREVTVDTDKDTLVVHDNALAGGYPLLRQDLSNLPAGTIDNTDINASAAIVDTKLDTIATAGKVSNSATTATDANTASAIVARDASGNFTAGTITAALTGAASSNVLKACDTMTGALVVPLASAATPSLTFTGDLNTGIFSPGADTLAITTAGTNRLHITSAGLVGIGTTTVSDKLHVAAGNITLSYADGSTGLRNKISWRTESPFLGEVAYIAADRTASSFAPTDIVIAAGTSAGVSEKCRVTSDGRLLIGTSSARGNFFNSTVSAALQVEGTGNDSSSLSIVRNSADTGRAILTLAKTRGGSVGSTTVVQSGDALGSIEFQGSDGTEFVQAAAIQCEVDGTPGANDMPGRLVFSTTADGASSPTERMRIDSVGAVLLLKTTKDYTTEGVVIRQGASPGSDTSFVTAGGTVVTFARSINDGTIISLRQDGTEEGTISVSGTTVSYNGAHLSRWSQLPSGAERTEILRGSVLSNIDEMCEWGEEDNEQLNRMKVSDVEGDKNVSGVFQAWDDDDDTYTNDFYCAMTGDFIIRIAAGVTVERGDLLMSAGDGTAKPQDDDIIRSKTIAKVTSTNVSCTYDDGSYCVPCVLMAC